VGAKNLACRAQAQEKMPNCPVLVKATETANQDPLEWAALLNSNLRPKCLSVCLLESLGSVVHLNHNSRVLSAWQLGSAFPNV
jgi:hypothetical protein